ncbi:SURF1 family protein [Bowmanella sp. Y26]|uniref:SURF1 family protein n=1 Tax=Bowmanella yangjiangensis TaxID=2811230 RepID=UPI001BDBB6F5|nr:SURF1 family protein [Bowmanella yangjiangensis]MBT1065810.1 SURF1 family protein [Bowmanella yangjiangensis]
MLLKLRALPFVAGLLALLAIVIMLRLGFWQLARAEQKQLRTQQLEQRLALQPLSLQDINRQSGDVADFPVQIIGKLDAKHILLWDNRVVNGQVGYEVLVPMTTDYGTVLVNLGWLKAPVRRDQLPELTLPKHRLTLDGKVVVPGHNPISREMTESGWPKRIQQPQRHYIESLLQTELLPYLVQVDDTQQFGYLNNWRPVVMPAEKHVAYAVQWFGLALACLIITLVAIAKQRKKYGKSVSP